MAYLFASDLHLSEANNSAVEEFLALLKKAAERGDSLYLLGDIFEIWLGDDDDSAPHAEIIAALAEYSKSGGELYAMSGNRDFLFGEHFSDQTGATLLDDWHQLDLFGVATLLGHGDLLCTKDVQYQAFRQYVRDPKNQQEFLAHPLDQRRAIAANTRTGTKASMLEKDDNIMDVEQATVEQVMRQFDVTRLIHGHTHRPGDHSFVDCTGISRERFVLGDWYDTGSVLLVDKNGVQRSTPSEYST